MLAGADKAALKLEKGASSFWYLNQSGVYTADGWDDAAVFKSMCASLEAIHVDAAAQQARTHPLEWRPCCCCGRAHVAAGGIQVVLPAQRTHTRSRRYLGESSLV